MVITFLSMKSATATIVLTAFTGALQRFAKEITTTSASAKTTNRGHERRIEGGSHDPHLLGGEMSWKAICPKCEKVYQMREYQPNFYCAHPNPVKNFAMVEATHMVNDVTIDKILCKIVEYKP